MKCPKCGGKAGVVDSSFNSERNEYFRKRKCKVCGHRFYTLEFEVDFDDQAKRDWYANHRLTKLYQL